MTFRGFMAHIEGYPTAYMTAAAAIGVKSDEIVTFGQRLDKTLTEFKVYLSKKTG